MGESKKLISKFVNDQLSVWPQAASNFRALKNVELRKVTVNGLDTYLQFNPARIRSSVAKTDKESLERRKCFLCTENRPDEQIFLKFEGRKNRRYHILVNLFPIFNDHLVIASIRHTPQTIWHRFVDLTDMARQFPDYTFFYNGPDSGASAPDHLHFQACPRGKMPLENVLDPLLDKARKAGQNAEGNPVGVEGELNYISSVQEAHLYHYQKFTRGIFALAARTSKSLAKLFYRLLDCAPVSEGDTEPRINLIAWYKPGTSASDKGEYRAIVTFRKQHRSHHYFSDGPDHLTMSPGTADMAGFFVIPEYSDFRKLDERLLSEVLSEVSVDEEVEKGIIWRLTRTQPLVHIGIMSAQEIVFEIISDGAGPQKVSYREGRIAYNGALYDELFFEAATMSTMFAEPTFILYDVTIGNDFHWQRSQDEKFAGSLKFIVDSGRVTAVNIVGMEDYLLSVISSEMRPDAPLQFLKAHAVISRSWITAMLEARKRRESSKPALPDGIGNLPSVVTDISVRMDRNRHEDELIRWFDHEDHKDFDACADDHCQRYQGIDAVVGKNVVKAVDETWGQVLRYDGDICDTRFSKCCGGVTEKFSSCWEDRDYPYLTVKPDVPETVPADGTAPEIAISHSDCNSHEAETGTETSRSHSGSHSHGTVTGAESSQSHSAVIPDLSSDSAFRQWIEAGTTDSQGGFCGVSPEEIASVDVMKDYDLETTDYYRWKVGYDTAALSELVCRKSGIDFGKILALIPVQRGGSGRIIKLDIVGEKKRMTVGKELIIRKFLSETHLKSSAFTVRYFKSVPAVAGTGNQDADGGISFAEIPQETIVAGIDSGKHISFDRIVLQGAGWGHGVGLCQIGAAVMSLRGYDYGQILTHYYPGAELS